MENQHESQSGSDINVQTTTSESSKRNTKAKAPAPANNNTATATAAATTPTKRNKSMRACDECRKRKVKCDGVQPCSKCRKSEIECVFAKLPPKRGPPKQYIELLEARLQLVEKALQSIDGPARRILDNALLGSVGGNNENTATRQDENTITPTTSSPIPTSTAMASYSSNSNNTIDPFGINEIGQAMYVNDVPERIDRIANLYGGEATQFISHHRDTAIMGQRRDNAMETDIKEESSSSASLLPPEVSQSLIETYFAHVHKFVPMIHNPMFYKQIGTATDIDPPSPLLLFAMCAVASRWTNECNNNNSSNVSSSSSSLSSPPPPSSSVPGFGYYQRAFAKVEEYSDAPRLSTIQGLVLLTKYQEYYKRLGFFRRPGLYLGIAAKMCNDLGLPQMESTPRPGQDPQEHEAKKRTFWTVFIYDLMMSIEQAREPYFSNADCTTEYPSVTSEEGPWLEEVVTSNIALIQLSRTLSEIYATIRRVTARQNAQGEKRSPVQVLEEQGKLFLLHTHLENFIHELPATLSYAPTMQIIAGVLPPYPAEKQAIGNVFAAFLHMTYHFSMILLHRHYLLHPLPAGAINNNDMMEPYQHQQLCAWAASNITAITETLLETQPLDVFSYPTRGVQHTIHCLTSAATVHHYEMSNPDKMIAEVAQQQYSRTLSILNRLAAESPAIELQSHIKEQDAELAQLYGRMVVDPARAVSSAGDSNNHPTPVSMATAPPQPPPPPATPMPQQDPLALSSDTSSASSSPVMSSPARGIRRHTLTGPGSHLMQMAMNNTPPQQQQQQQQTMPYMLDGGGATSLFNSSAAFSDPSRFASLMMRGGTTNMAIYNHHQQPLPVQQQAQHLGNPQAYLQRKSRLRHPMSYSQEDLRSLRRAHMNKPLGGGSNWPPAHARGSPIPPDFVYDSSSSTVMESGNQHQQQPRLARSLRRQSSMTAMMPSYYAQRQQQLPLRRQPSHHPSTALPHQPFSSHHHQQPLHHHHHPSPPRMPTVATTPPSLNHPRRHTISIPSEPSASTIVPAYMNNPTPPHAAAQQQQASSFDQQQPPIDPFISDTTMMNLDTMSATTPSDYAYSPAVSTPMDTATTPVSTPAGMMVMDSSNNDTIMNDLMLQMGAAGQQWSIPGGGFDHTTSSSPGPFVEDIQRSEGHVI